MSAIPDPPTPPWTQGLHALLARIESHPFDHGDACVASGDPLGFTRRLARDHNWTLPFARAAIREYGRFCFLAVATPSPVTPSEEVDEVWHLHLTYSRDYWTVWCPTVLQTPLHHDPTKGGPAEQARFRAQYAQTLAAYEPFFGPPPEPFWPATHRRFRARPRFRMLDADRAIALPRPGALLSQRSRGWTT